MTGGTASSIRLLKISSVSDTSQPWPAVRLGRAERAMQWTGFQPLFTREESAQRPSQRSLPGGLLTFSLSRYSFYVLIYINKARCPLSSSSHFVCYQIKRF